MDFKLLKQILQKEKSKIVIVEDGKPLMVVLPFEEYLKEPKKEDVDLSSSRIEKEKRELVNISKTKEEPKAIPSTISPRPSYPQSQEKLTIDDLPL